MMRSHSIKVEIGVKRWRYQVNSFIKKNSCEIKQKIQQFQLFYSTEKELFSL